MDRRCEGFISKMIFFKKRTDLCDEGRSGLSFILPSRAELLGALVVTSKTVNTRFNENETELGVLVFAITFQMLADLDGLLDQVVQIFRDGGSQTVSLQDANQFGSCDTLDLTYSMRITENDANLSRSKTLLGQFTDLFANFFTLNFKPARCAAAVRQSGA